MEVQEEVLVVAKGITLHVHVGAVELEVVGDHLRLALEGEEGVLSVAFEKVHHGIKELGANT